MLKKLVVVFAIMLLSSTAYAQDTKSIKMDNKEWVKQFYTELNNGDMKFLDTVVADDYVENEPLPGFELNKKGLIGYFEMIYIAFPDFKAEIDFMMQEGDKVAVYLTYSGTHKGVYMGAKGSGKKINFKAVDIIEVKNGKMVEHWGVLDVLTMMSQLEMVDFK
jgi:steroid delta-isomerase-like uncharacterized protein